MREIEIIEITATDNDNLWVTYRMPETGIVIFKEILGNFEESL